VIRYWLLADATTLLGGCHPASVGTMPAPAAPPPRAVVALSDVIINIK